MAAASGERLACGVCEREMVMRSSREKERERERKKRKLESCERQRRERMGCEFIGMVLL